MLKRIVTSAAILCCLLSTCGAAQAADEIDLGAQIRTSIEAEHDENVSALVSLLIMLGFEVEVIDYRDLVEK